MKITYTVRKVDASDDEIAEIICEFNRTSEARFPKLQDKELEGVNCFWWLAYLGNAPVGFTGLVPSAGIPGAGYLKRAGVDPRHRGHGLQRRFVRVREMQARKVGWGMIITETTNADASAINLSRCGYQLFTPQKPWAFENSLYWRKYL